MRNPLASVHTAPGPRGWPLVGSLPDFAWGDPIETVMRATREYGDHVRFRAGPYFFHLVNHPDYIRHVLQENAANYVKSANYDELRRVVGNGLLTSEGSFWLRQRRLAQPAFHRQRLAALGAEMVAATESMLERWRVPASQGRAFDLAAEMHQLTFAIVGRTLFDTDLSRQAAAVGPALLEALRWANDRTTQIVRIPPSVPTPANVRARKAIATLDRMVLDIVESRRKDARDHGDLLSMLLEARDEATGEGMTDRQLRDEVMTLALAGHETTANNLAWTFYLLAQSPPVERKLRAELATVLGGRAPRVEDLPRLEYTRMVVDEALRLYPPAWFIERQTLRADRVGEYWIPAGTMVGICTYAMHRHPAYWENPEGFDPERFSAARAADRPKFAYLPFGGGPRVCIGNQFALMEAALVLATIVQRYRLELVPGRKVRMEPIVTLRPRDGVWMVPRAPSPAEDTAQPEARA